MHFPPPSTLLLFLPLLLALIDRINFYLCLVLVLELEKYMGK